MRSVLTMVGVLLFVGCDLRDLREESKRRSMENNLKQLDLAIKNYEQSYRKHEDTPPSDGVAERDPVSPPR
ncbi:MAG: hypothetical protein ABL921_02075 [Pirellula sp.]